MIAQGIIGRHVKKKCANYMQRLVQILCYCTYVVFPDIYYRLLYYFLLSLCIILCTFTKQAQ